jgi:hypothetical protein
LERGAIQWKRVVYFGEEEEKRRDQSLQNLMRRTGEVKGVFIYIDGFLADIRTASVFVC